MSIRTISSREFNQDVTGAKNASRNGPVIITDRGKPSHVLLTIDEYHNLTCTSENILDLLAMPEEGLGIKFDPKPLRGPVAKPVDFS